MRNLSALALKFIEVEAVGYGGLMPPYLGSGAESAFRILQFRPFGPKLEDGRMPRFLVKSGHLWAKIGIFAHITGFRWESGYEVESLESDKYTKFTGRKFSNICRFSSTNISRPRDLGRLKSEISWVEISDFRAIYREIWEISR